MKFLEKDLEEIIFETSNEELRNRGLNIYGRKYRQLRIGNYGVADIVCVNRVPNFESNGYCHQHLLINVIELKKDGIGISAFLQAVGYVKGIKSYLSKMNRLQDVRLDFKITLIGSHMKTDSSFTYLGDLIPSIECEFDCEFLSNYTFEYKFNGINFNDRSGYKLTNEGF